ncbi:MAG: dual specificity protein phosphatase family protein [Myxococcales bacterium]|nr:dual specificity protein phosphatase family protein [Myxococcales bacterium]
MQSWIARIIYAPTVLYQLATRIFTKRRVWDVVDETLVLGAMPLRWDVKKLASMGIKGVINNCAEYSGPQKSYARYNIDQFYLPVIDFTPPKLEEINAALSFIEQHRQRGERVYLHCKAGRGRSATIALCYLITRYQLTPEQAQQRLQAIRPRIVRDLWQREVVQEFFLQQQQESPTLSSI